jgi:hypothetical protein
MQQKINVQEMAIVLAVQEFDPTLITIDFLKQTGLIPAAWEVVGEPIRSFQGSQINFQQGVSIIAEPQRISFAELVANKSPDTLDVPKLASGFARLLGNLEFVGAGLNFRGYVEFEGTVNGSTPARDFMFKNLLAPGDWQSLGTAPAQAGINLGYTFDRRRLNLTINDGILQIPEQPPIAIVLFSGNFDYDLERSISPQARTNQVGQIVASWHQDLALYQDVVSRFVLSPSIIPFPTVMSS